ncbi:hypothetical protein [Thiothrix lacustris]|uniref:hypothetical protein n=1 Tax=Thiothrix lacustris TaxID=525917 RepID=UPI000491E3E9|nr:hypothetical protein [Thiothrix lacustris]
MKKTYTIQSIVCTEISPGKGSMAWQLRDNADERLRKVSGISTLDKNGLIESVRSIYTREAPLVEELLLCQEGDTFSIDFSDFNQAQGYINREMYANMQKCERLSCMVGKLWRVLAVMALLVILSLVWMLNSSMTKFSQQQPLIHHEQLP